MESNSISDTSEIEERGKLETKPRHTGESEPEWRGGTPRRPAQAQPAAAGGCVVGEAAVDLPTPRSSRAWGGDGGNGSGGDCSGGGRRTTKTKTKKTRKVQKLRKVQRFRFRCVSFHVALGGLTCVCELWPVVGNDHFAHVLLSFTFLDAYYWSHRFLPYRDKQAVFGLD